MKKTRESGAAEERKRSDDAKLKKMRVWMKKIWIL
jgi:hypothetical protein